MEEKANYLGVQNWLTILCAFQLYSAIFNQFSTSFIGLATFCFTERTCGPFVHLFSTVGLIIKPLFTLTIRPILQWTCKMVDFINFCVFTSILSKVFRVLGKFTSVFYRFTSVLDKVASILSKFISVFYKFTNVLDKFTSASNYTIRQ